MTEKRFTLKPYDGIRCDVLDGEIEIAEVHRDDAKGLVDLLNELHEENEQLKANYNSLSHNNGLLYNECTNKINALKKENEKLEKQRDFYYARLQKIIKIANGDWE